MSASHIVAFPSQSEDGSPADRVRRLQAEVRTLAREHIEMLGQALNEVTRLSGEISGGGDAYPVGVRELSRRLADETPRHIQTLAAILDRV